jgi:hypothetical protein
MQRACPTLRSPRRPDLAGGGPGAADGRFSVVIGTDYEPATHEPVKTELLSPLYRHDQD